MEEWTSFPTCQGPGAQLGCGLGVWSGFPCAWFVLVLPTPCPPAPRTQPCRPLVQVPGRVGCRWAVWVGRGVITIVVCSDVGVEVWSKNLELECSAQKWVCSRLPGAFARASHPREWTLLRELHSHVLWFGFGCHPEG